jgi:hypothetical protein
VLNSLSRVAGRQSSYIGWHAALMRAGSSDIRSNDRHRGRRMVAPLALEQNDADPPRRSEIQMSLGPSAIDITLMPALRRREEIDATLARAGYLAELSQRASRADRTT